MRRVRRARGARRARLPEMPIARATLPGGVECDAAGERATRGRRRRGAKTMRDIC
jgi:hypothetical protein